MSFRFDIVDDDATPPSGTAGAGSGARWIALMMFVVVALGIGLRTAQYLGRIDMWHDELAVARNVEDRSLSELLTRPLDHQQVAPVGFLAALDVATEAIGTTEMGFRFVPWLFALAALLLFWRVARRFADGYALLTALALFAVSPALIWYGTSVKPYGSDVAISLLLVWFALRYLERPDEAGRSLAAGIVGGAALLVSFPAVPTAAVLGAILLAARRRLDPRPSLRPLALMGAGWAAGAIVAGVAAKGLMDPATDDFMRQFWAEDFPPLGPLAAPLWMARKFYDVFAHSMIFVPASGPALSFIVGLPLVLALAGLIFTWRDRRVASLLVLAPIVAAMAAAFGRLLPFDNRVGLHAAWPVLVLAAVGLAGLERLARGRARLLPRALAGLAAVPLTLVVLFVARPPLGADLPNARNVLEALADRMRPDDVIYVYTQGRHDIAWYGSRAGIDEWIQGERHYDDPRAYLREVDTMRGQPRAWFFWVQLDRPDPQLIRDYVGTIGRELDALSEEGSEGSGAVLYDLSDPDRLMAADAETFEHPSLQEGQ